MSGQVSGCVCREWERKKWRGCVWLCVHMCVYLAVCNFVYFGYLSLFDLRMLRGGKGREGRVSPASGD